MNITFILACDCGEEIKLGGDNPFYRMCPKCGKYYKAGLDKKIQYAGQIYPEYLFSIATAPPETKNLDDWWWRGVEK